MIFQFKYRVRIAQIRCKLTQGKRAISYVSIRPRKVVKLRVKVLFQLNDKVTILMAVENRPNLIWMPFCCSGHFLFDS